jgi:hypothetical protein
MEKIKCLGSNTIPQNTHPRTTQHPHHREVVPLPKRVSKPPRKPDQRRRIDIYV